MRTLDSEETKEAISELLTRVKEQPRVSGWQFASLAGVASVDMMVGVNRYTRKNGYEYSPMHTGFVAGFLLGYAMCFGDAVEGTAASRVAMATQRSFT